MSKTEMYLSKIVKYGLYAILLTPLVFWPRALYAFLTPKFILFQVLVEIVFFAFALKALYNANLRMYSNSTNIIRRIRMSFVDLNYIKGALFLFLSVSLLLAIFGVDFSRSFWGIGARMSGLFSELHFFAWFLLLISYFKNDKEKWSRYMNVSFVVALLVALSAFYENTSWRLVYGSTFFNNPTFVAPYFLFHFFWGLYQVWKSKSFNKLFFGIGSALILIALLLGEVRGAIIGLAAGVLFLGIGLMFSNIFSWRRRIAIAICYLLLLMSAVVFWQWRNASFIQNNDLLKKFGEISITATTAQTRILLWQTSLKGFFDRPALGTGPENFNYLFNVNYNPQFLKYGGGSFAETWQDKPHNAFLEILTEVGLVGSLFYVLIWLASVFALLKLFRSGQKFLTLILGGAFISYIGAVFFSFDSFGSWLGLYLFLAFLASHNNPNLQIYPNSANIVQRFKNLFVVLGWISVLGLLWINLSIWRANIADADALRVFPRDPGQGIILFKKSLNYFSPYKSEYQFDLIASVAGAIEKGIPLQNLEDTINFSLSEADKAVSAHPKDAAKYTDMARIYNIFGTVGRDPQILAQAEAFEKKSLELSPQRQETMFYIARTALLKNDAKTAVTWAKQAVLADSSIKQSHWYLGLSYIADNQRQEGIAEIKKALELGYKLQNQAETNFVKQLGL